jgi:hypothetical protein
VEGHGFAVEDEGTCDLAGERDDGVEARVVAVILDFDEALWMGIRGRE